MSISSIMEKWDTIAYLGYNMLACMQFILRYPKYRKYLKLNRALYKKHDGKRCFIVLNGPSLKRYDLSKITNEYVFCTNIIYSTPEVDIIKPNYYCITDYCAFMNPDSEHSLDKIFHKCYYSDFFLNLKYFNVYKVDNDRIHGTFNKHMPNMFKTRNNLAGLSSSFFSVSLYAMNVAIYLGFKEIYLLGYDFEPGVFKHFYQESEADSKVYDDQRNEIFKDDVCGKYWQYSQAQYQNYHMRKFAALKGVAIYNCNKDSCVRSFPFVEYEKIFLKDKEA